MSAASTAHCGLADTLKENGMAAGLFLLGLVAIVVYFIPAAVGFARRKENRFAIFLLNLFLGWSLLGWVVALVWAVSKDKLPQAVIMQAGSERP